MKCNVYKTKYTNCTLYKVTGGIKYHGNKTFGFEHHYTNELLKLCG